MIVEKRKWKWEDGPLGEKEEEEDGTLKQKPRRLHMGCLPHKADDSLVTD